jgi:hypothetical protein
MRAWKQPLADDRKGSDSGRCAVGRRAGYAQLVSVEIAKVRYVELRGAFAASARVFPGGALLVSG